MLTIYLVSQIFRYLKDEQKDNHLSELQNILITNKDDLICFYSHEHLLDLKNDHSVIY